MGLDDTFRALIRPNDARSTRGIMSRGTPVYKGGVPNPTPTGVVSQNLPDVQRLQQLAKMRLGLM